MKIESWYSQHFESRLQGRYITLQHILPLLKMHKNNFEVSTAGISELGKEIPLITFGKGNKIVLAWSQMHGNESTTTKAIFDFLKFLGQNKAFKEEISHFLNNYTLYIIPILNPDGAELYKRENSNGIDLNRDAKILSQTESIVLRKIYDNVKPQICLNLHDQRTIYGLKNGLPATVSFLSPSANKERSLTPSRKVAMEHIVRMNTMLQKYIPGQVGRYKDTFNENCVGDTFQMDGTPTILFEAGHYSKDYNREKTREYIFYGFLSLFGITEKIENDINFEDYFSILENQKNFKDFILRDIKFGENGESTSISLQYSEILIDNHVEFVPAIENIGKLNEFYGHIEKDGKNATILVDSHDLFNIGDEISIIVNKDDHSLVYFDKNSFLI